MQWSITLLLFPVMAAGAEWKRPLSLRSRFDRPLEVTESFALFPLLPEGWITFPLIITGTSFPFDHKRLRARFASLNLS